MNEMMPSLRHYKTKKCNILETKWGVLTQIINDKVGTRIKIMVGRIGEVEIREIERLTKIEMYLHVIVNNQNTQLG